MWVYLAIFRDIWTKTNEFLNLVRIKISEKISENGRKRVEARMLLPHGTESGSWPAFWMLPTNNMRSNGVYTACRLLLTIVVDHSGWRASFLAFCLGMYTIYIPCTSSVYSMYVYNYIHIWRAACNVQNPPANNYGSHWVPFVVDLS